MTTTTSEHADRGGSQQDVLQEADQHNAPHREEPQQEEPQQEEPRNATFQHDGDGGAQFTGGHHGDIYQIYASMERSENVVRRMLGRRVAPSPMNPDSVHRLERVFCPPEHYDVALATLRNSNTVVITGARGSGRHSAAMKLLSEVAESSHDLSNEADEEEDLLDPEAVGVGEGLLLDLSACSLETVEALLRRWEPLRAKVAAKKCFSVIVLAENAQHLLASDLRGHLVTIGHPDSSRVLAQHLAWQGVLVNESDLDSAQLPPRLQRMSMGELSALAGLVRETRGAGEVLERLQQALEASKPRPEHVTTWLRKHVARGEHALMLSAAMLAGAHTDAVFAASEDLRGVVDPADDEGNPLEREGVSERLSEVDIGVDDDRCVTFGTLDFDHQIRTHFWREHPGLRDELRDWVGRVAPSSALESSRNELVFRFAEQALAAGRPRDLSALVEQWARADGGPSARMLGCVGLVLRAGLLDERFDGWFRQRVYDWARRPRGAGLPSSFDFVLITLCESVIAPLLPDRALVRLHHFARRDDHQVAGEAARRIEKLAASRIFFRRALYRLVDYLHRKDETSNVVLFLRIVDPQRLVSCADSVALIADRGVREQLVSGWRFALDRPVQAWQQRVRDWLQAEADDPGCTDLVDVLVEAADRRAPVLGGLHGVARRWADEATGETRRRRARVAVDLTGRIDVAQNLEFLTKTGEAAR